MLRSGQIDLTAGRAADLRETENAGDKLRQLVERDINRHRAHRDRAAELDRIGLTMPPTMFLVGNPSKKQLAASSPMLADLLHYLTEILRHYHPAYTHDERGKLVTPRVSWPSQWHISRSSDWCTGPGATDGQRRSLASSRFPVA
jgi:hypothetical protein